MAELNAIEIAGLPGACAEGEGVAHDFPLLFVHGVMGDHGVFDAYLRYFSSRGFDSYAFSRRGRRGVPPANARGVRTRDYLQDCVKVVEALDRVPVVVGHSLGGLLAQQLAEAGRCRGIVLVESSPPRGVGVRPPASALPVYLSATLSILSGRPKLVPYGPVARAALRSLPEDQRRRIYAGFVPESGRVWRALALGVPVDRAKVSCPVLVLTAEEDGIYPPRIGRAIARRYGADLREYPGNDHWIIDEPGWEQAASDIADWLDKLA